MLSYTFRLYPTPEIEKKLVETLDGCRWVYNHFLTLQPMSEYDMNYALVELKERYPWLRNYYAKMLQMVGKQIAAARKALEVLKAHGHKAGKLRYREHKDYNSFTYNQSGFMIVGSKLRLSKIGDIKIVLHRQPINHKQVTVVRKAGKWYALVACKTSRRIFHFVTPRKSVGIDVGITRFAYDSDNHCVDNPLFLTRMLRPLRRSSRKVSRRQKGSNNHAKAKNILARIHHRITNKRKDFLHSLSNYYAQRYDLVFVERLRTLNMVKNHHLAKHILDSGWRTFMTMLGYKAKKVVEVEPYHTSIDCSRCGHEVQKELAIRTHRCDACGIILDRDYNASLNIKHNGLSCLPVECREVTPVEIECRSLKQEAHIKGG